MDEGVGVCSGSLLVPGSGCESAALPTQSEKQAAWGSGAGFRSLWICICPWVTELSAKFPSCLVPGSTGTVLRFWFPDIQPYSPCQAGLVLCTALGSKQTAEDRVQKNNQRRARAWMKRKWERINDVID